jgi:thioredoxin-like negative regulator of GroEL
MMGGGGRRGGGPGADANPEAEALQKALEAKASTEEIKTALAKYREARKTKEAALAKAREELKKVLSVRQEATMVMMGLLE